MSCLGDMTPFFKIGFVNDPDVSLLENEEEESWEAVWQHYYDLIAFQARGDSGMPPPPDNWNQHFSSARRVNRYGLMFTPVEENGLGPFQLRRFESNGETKFSAKYTRSGESIDIPGFIPSDGTTPMEYMVSPFIPQAVEDCVTVIGSITGKGQFSGITGYETRRIPMGHVLRSGTWCDIRDQDSLSWMASDREAPKVNPDPFDELSWYKSDREDLHQGCEPRIVPCQPQKQLAKTALRNLWYPPCSKAIGLITNSERAKRKASTRFNKLLVRIKLFKAAVPVKNPTEHFDNLEDKFFITAVELFNTCQQDFHEGFFEEEGSMGDVNDPSKIEGLSNGILEHMLNCDRNGWPV